MDREVGTEGLSEVCATVILIFIDPTAIEKTPPPKRVVSLNHRSQSSQLALFSSSTEMHVVCVDTGVRRDARRINLWQKCWSNSPVCCTFDMCVTCFIALLLIVPQCLLCGNRNLTLISSVLFPQPECSDKQPLSPLGHTAVPFGGQTTLIMSYK